MSLTVGDWAQIRELRENHRHALEPTVSGHGARNPGLGMAAEFDGRSAMIEPSGGEWQFGLALRSYGFEGSMTTLSVPAFGTCVEGGEVTYGWSEGLEEWWINDSRGFEHGFTLSERPACWTDSTNGSSPLRFRLDVLGTLRPAVTDGDSGLVALDASGHPVLRYEGLFAFDANGAILDAWLELEAGCLSICVEESKACYPITVDPVVQQAYLKASNTEDGDLFGRVVAISGDTVVVGADNEESSATGVNGNQFDNSAFEAGAAYVFVRSGGSWVQEAYLKASNTDAGDCFGLDVAISGDTIVVGAHHESSSAVGVNGDEADNSLSVSGAAYVFVRSGGTWAQQAYLKASNTGFADLFGISVDVSGDTVVVGAPQEDSGATGVNGNEADNSKNSAGAAYVFVRSGGTWMQEAYLKASNPDSSDFFGVSVGVSEETVVVGAHFEDSSATGVNGDGSDNSAQVSGAAYVFNRSAGGWTHQAYLKASNTDSSDRFGEAVAISADTIIVGATGESSDATGVNGNQADNSSDSSGAVYTFTSSGGSWNQEAYLKASNTSRFDRFGDALAISGDALVVGAPTEDSGATGVNGDGLDNSALDAGAAYVFVRVSAPWVQVAYLKASNTDADDVFGSTVGISGDSVAAGSLREDSSATGVNGNAANNAAPFAGAAYVFAGVGPPDLGFPLCTGVPNSTGASSSLTLLGSDVAADNDLTLEVVGLPSMVAGYFLTSSGTNTINNAGGSAGTLCISSADIGRYAGNVLSSGSTGAVSQVLDLSSVPSATGSVQVLAGETRYFQFWHRDTLVFGIPTSNFSGARGVAFQ